MAGSLQVVLAVVPVSGLGPSQYLRGYCGGTGITGGTGILITRGLAAVLVLRASVRSSLTFCVKLGAQQDCM